MAGCYLQLDGYSVDVLGPRPPYIASELVHVGDGVVIVLDTPNRQRPGGWRRIGEDGEMVFPTRGKRTCGIMTR